MQELVIKGGVKLKGTVTISGSKNAALPIVCAALLSKDKTVLKNVPDIADIHSIIKIIESLGVKTKFNKNTLEIDPSKLTKSSPDQKLVEKMRASILLIGGILPRLGEIKMAFPGGCVLGKRSVYAHTHVFKEFGAKILNDKTGLHIKADKLVGKKFTLPEQSVTATENAIMCGVLAEGKTEIRLSAVEPHVQDLCHFLKKMGAKISGIGTNNIQITGVESLKGTTYTITGDYLEAGTFAIAAVATGGDVIINGINTDHLDILWQKFNEMGVSYKLSKDSVHILLSKSLKGTDVKTAVYPGFPTDLQAPFTVLLTQVNGTSKIFETLFEGRLNYLFELEVMGAQIHLLNPHQALVQGPSKLKGMSIPSHDIRAGAAMVIAALVAKDYTTISNINYIDRGYENLDGKLTKLGAEIKRLKAK